jgi:hypothetical protein
MALPQALQSFLRRTISMKMARLLHWEIFYDGIAVTDDLGIPQLKNQEVSYAFVGREQHESPSKNGRTHPG